MPAAGSLGLADVASITGAPPPPACMCWARLMGLPPTIGIPIGLLPAAGAAPFDTAAAVLG